MIDDHSPSILEQARLRLREIAGEEHFLDSTVSVLAKALTPEEAIGTPGRRDFPIIIGKERMLEAKFFEAKGHAFTDSPGEYIGTLVQVLDLELTTNLNRAIFVAALNAVLRHLGMVTATVHCKDDEPEQCATEIANRILEEYGKVNVGLIGLNPAIAEKLVEVFGSDRVRISDLYRDNIGKKRFGVQVWDGGVRTNELIETSDVILFTGTTLQNDTFDHIWHTLRALGKGYFVYGVTAAGVCFLNGIDRICPCGRDS